VVTIKREIVSLIPAFELGLWNAWILILPVIIASVFGAKILSKRKSEDSLSFSLKVKAATFLYFLIELSLYAYSIFLPLNSNTIWLIVGVLIYAPSFCFLTLGLLNFAATPAKELVTTGAYSISRNPSYVCDVLVKTSIGIACFSWIFLLIAVIDFVLLRTIVVAEERVLLERYEITYRKYLNRTPRWIGIPKAETK
jgi:protein-S-isoprenylcysteine O-methyltransferase Ste14